MSTIVVVKKGRRACIAADSLTSFGETRQSADYDAFSDKIQAFGDTYIGIVGSAAHSVVLESVMGRKDFDAQFDSRAHIFETFLRLHRTLKKHYYLNPKDDDEDPYESTHIDALVANSRGIFGVYSLREVYEYQRFWAIGSGADFALGAMFAAYDQYEKPQDIARIGIEAGAEFNSATALPMTLRRINLLARKD
jgi:ATP-dependent protease HslVU (ClpYQ) peptidase subunit